MNFSKYLPVLLMLALGISLSIVAFFVLKNVEEDRADAEFERAAESVAATIDDRFQRNIDLLHSIRDLYSVSETVDRAQFSQFVKGAREAVAGVQALEWIPRVLASERLPVELAARTDGFTEFEITERNFDGTLIPAAERDELFPVYFVDPIQGNEAALGFDLGSSITRLRALASARDSGVSVATERISLVQETGNQFGFLVFVPVYENGAITDTVEARRESLDGFALGVFRVGDAVEAPLTGGDVGRGIGLQINDFSAPPEQALLYENSDLSLPTNSDAPVPGAQFSSGRVIAREIEVGGRRWQMLLSPASGVFEARMWIPGIGLSGGLLISFLLAAYGYALQGRTARVEKTVQTRTAELTRAYERISESEADARAITENAVDGIITIDESGIVGSINPAAEQIFQIQSVDIVGKNISELMPEPDRSHHDAYLSAYKRTGDRKILGVGREVTGLRHDGTTFPMDLAVNEMGGNGPRRYVGVIRDITNRVAAEQELRESEERYRDLFENATDLIQIVDVDGRYLFTNSAWNEALGYAEGEVIGKPFADVVHPDELDHCNTVFQRSLSGEQVGEIDTVFAKRDGGSIAVRGSISVKFEAGSPVSTRGIFRDVTSRLEVERMKSEFIGIVSHELRTPLTSIRGSLGLMAAGGFGELPEDAAEAIDIAVRNTDRLSRMVGDFLDLERIESGQLPLAMGKHATDSLVAEVLSNLATLADDRSIKLVSSVDSPYVYGDRDRIIQAITNLGSNAIKFSPEESIITFSAQDEGDSTLISVTDEGPGILKELQTAVFDRFRQVTADDYRRRGGIGLGLAIARGIAESHGGQIYVESEFGQGSRFTVSLPSLQAIPVSTQDQLGTQANGSGQL